MSRRVKNLLLCVLLYSGSQSVFASAVLYDDFEDGLTTGWLTTTSGFPGGATGVELHNGSQMAFVSHASVGRPSGGGRHALSQDFAYNPLRSLLFDMHATADAVSGAVGGTKHAKSGVTISFLDFISRPLGSVGLVYSSSGVVGPDEFLIDNAQLHYDLRLPALLSLAGLTSSDPVTKFSVSFWASSEHFFGGGIYPDYRSRATVWFDNVQVIPIPAGLWLMISAVAAFVAFRRRA